MSAPVACQVVNAFHEHTGKTILKRLSKREHVVLMLLVRGLQYKEIAHQLGISIGTVRTHIVRIYEKLHVNSRAEAMLKVTDGPNMFGPDKQDP